MSSNKHVKDEMIQIFGKKCFVEELHLRKADEIEQDKRRFKGKSQKCIMDMLTYHHILERCKGGKATVENGALLRNINHIWFHRLPKAQQDKINNLFQEYKRQFYHKTEIEFVDSLDTGIELNIAELEATDRELRIKKREYNRAKEKRKTRKAKEDYERDSDT